MDFLTRRRRRPSRISVDNDPFPWRQMTVLALCRICEPIAFMSIFPYIYYMVESFNITSNDKEIAIYAGMITSAFAFAEFSTGVLWGRLSDVVGRKPVLLTGLAGTGISMIVFGFAPSLQVALIARALGGLLNGNIGVIHTTVAEVVRSEKHRPRAYSIMPFVWCLGSIIGSSLGGTLAEPCKNYPSIFKTGSMFDRFPFLLPNLVCTFVVVCGLAIGILFLEETHEKKKHSRDIGREVGKLLLCKIKKQGDHEYTYSKLDEAGGYDSTSSSDDEFSSCSSSRTVSPRLSAIDRDSALDCIPNEKLDIDIEAPRPCPSFKSAFNKPVLLAVVAYGILAFHTITLEQLIPIMLSMKMSDNDSTTVLPFKFTGGFNLPTSTIGLILSFQGVFQMFAQIVVFPKVVKRFGPLKTLRFALLTYPFLYVIAPYLILLPDSLRYPGLFFILLWKVTYQSLAFPSIMLFLTNAAPSLLLLGAINGVAASAASLSRAIGPTMSGVIESAGLSIGYAGLAWWASAIIAFIGAVECLFLRECDLEESSLAPASVVLADPRSSGVSDTTLVEDHEVDGVNHIQVLPKD